jgi:hypothetical protein
MRYEHAECAARCPPHVLFAQVTGVEAQVLKAAKVAPRGVNGYPYRAKRERGLTRDTAQRAASATPHLHRTMRRNPESVPHAAKTCPILGARWEQRSAASCGQKPSDGVNAAVSTGLTCRNAPDLGSRSPGLSVVVLGAGGSSPLAHPIETQVRSPDRVSRSGLLHVAARLAPAPPAGARADLGCAVPADRRPPACLRAGPPVRGPGNA